DPRWRRLGGGSIGADRVHRCRSHPPLSIASTGVMRAGSALYGGACSLSATGYEGGRRGGARCPLCSTVADVGEPPVPSARPWPTWRCPPATPSARPRGTVHL